MGQFDALKSSLDDHIQGVNRYNLENVTELQQCVAAMASENRYDRDIALTTLKLYQLNPDKYDEATVRTILLKTLTVLPGSDFALAKCLIDANRINSPELQLVLNLGSVLESCDFGVFWKLARGKYPADNKFKAPAEIAKLMKPIPGFEEAVRVFACRVVSTTGQCIDRVSLVKLLGGVNDAKVVEYSRKFDWEIREGGSSFYFANHDSTIKSSKPRFKVHFKHDKFGYPAKIQAVAKDEKGKTRFKIHFKRLLDESKGKTSKKKSIDTPSASSAKKSKKDTVREGSADTSSQTSDIRTMTSAVEETLTLTIPDKLRTLLSEDSDVVNRQCKLAKLPAQYTVDRIIKEYAASLANGNMEEVAGNDEILVEYIPEGEGGGAGHTEVVLNKHDMVQSSLGIYDYFNVLLGSQLLYDREKAQFKAFCLDAAADAPGEKVDTVKTPELDGIKIIPSSIYGFSHLLRLFIRLGPLLSQCSYGNKQVSIVVKHIHDFLVFLNKNASTYYDINRDYEVAATPN